MGKMGARRTVFAARPKLSDETLTRWTRLLAVAAALTVAAAAASGASAHPRLLSTSPPDGAVLAAAPSQVVVRFDDSVRILGGTTVVRNADQRSVIDRKPHASGGVVVMPLQRLGDGDYSVRWHVLTDDGHDLQGVLAFAVGVGRAPPQVALSAGSGGPSARDVASRWLFFAGLLIAVGVAIFLLLGWRPAAKAAGGGVDDGVLWVLAFAGFFLAFLGAAGLTHRGGDLTRFDVMYDIGGVAAIVGATLAAVALVDRRFGVGAFAAALVLLPVPSLAGHALDRGQWRPLNAAADMLHISAAAVWIGGLLALAVALPRAARRLEPEQRARFTHALVPRLSAIALGSVLVIAATGLVRALSELSAVSQLWNTGYGRALVIKTALLVLVVALGWINRSRLLPHLGALRRNVAAELLLLAGIVTAVAFLTDLAPGRQVARAVARPAAPEPRPIEPPPPGATVLGAQSSSLAVGLAALPGGRVEATVVGPNNHGVDALAVSFRSGGRTLGSRPCGPGCYRAADPVAGRRVTVLPGSSPPVSFELPSHPQPARALVAKATRAYRGLRSLVIHERLASSPQNRVSSTWEIVAPNRLTYVTSSGARAVVIGPRRWDKIGNGPWQPSPQTPLSLPGSQWSPGALDARTLGWRTVDGRRARLVSFFDPRLPAWFELALEPRTNRPLELKMTAAAHFMHHRYTDFNRPLPIVPPR
jgi:copper transport protein